MALANRRMAPSAISATPKLEQFPSPYRARGSGADCRDASCRLPRRRRRCRSKWQAARTPHPRGADGEVEIVPPLGIGEDAPIDPPIAVEQRTIDPELAESLAGELRIPKERVLDRHARPAVQPVLHPQHAALERMHPLGGEQELELAQRRKTLSRTLLSALTLPISGVP